MAWIVVDVKSICTEFDKSSYLQTACEKMCFCQGGIFDTWNEIMIIFDILVFATVNIVMTSESDLNERMGFGFMVRF